MGSFIRFHMFAVVWCVLAVVLGGCATTQPATFYVLSGLDGQNQPAQDHQVHGQWPAIDVGPIKLPGYLDRPQIVTRTSANTLALAEFDKWAEPLSDSIGRVLAQNLSVLLHEDRLLVRTWDAVPVTYQLVVEVARFDGGLGGELTLVARWRVSRERRSNVVVARTSRVAVAVKGRDYGDLVDAMNRSLEELSQEIAAAIRDVTAMEQSGTERD